DALRSCARICSLVDAMCSQCSMFILLSVLDAMFVLCSLCFTCARCSMPLAVSVLTLCSKLYSADAFTMPDALRARRLRRVHFALDAHCKHNVLCLLHPHSMCSMLILC